jgi:hypothetical protein
MLLGWLAGHEWEEAPSLLMYTSHVMRAVPRLVNRLFPEAQLSERVRPSPLVTPPVNSYGCRLRHRGIFRPIHDWMEW